MLLATILVTIAAAYAIHRELGAEVSPLDNGVRSSYVSTYEVVTTFPHDTNAFTQGLVFDDAGTLYESDGLYRRSQVRSVHVQTGSSEAHHNQKKTANGASHFGEGIAIVGHKLLQLTWQERVVNEFSLPSLQHTQTHKLPCASGTDTQTTVCREGWGLAYDGTKLYLTDSTDKVRARWLLLWRRFFSLVVRSLTSVFFSLCMRHTQLFFLDPKTLQSVKPPRQIYDPIMKRPIHGVNELEWVDGELWGNVFPMYQGEASECIVRINATDGQVKGWIDLRGLLGKQRNEVRMQSRNFVLNGIAYHPNSKRLYVTGKQWDHMYQIRVKPSPPEEQTGAFIQGNCHLGNAEGRHFG